MTHRHTLSTTRRRAGFSLVEILVVIAIIGLLGAIGTQVVLSAQEAGRVTKCQSNLGELAKTMSIYVETRNKGRWPKEAGIRFLLALHRDDQIRGKNSDLFLCPGTDDENDIGTGPGSAYEDFENIDSATISYAGRDNINHRIRSSALESMVIAADDNEFGPNHRTATNYAYADGSVFAFDAQIDGGDLLEEYPEYAEDGIPVGPDSPVELFQPLSID